MSTVRWKLSIDQRVRLIRIHLSEVMHHLLHAEHLNGRVTDSDVRGEISEAKTRLHEIERLLDGEEPAMFPEAVKAVTAPNKAA